MSQTIGKLAEALAKAQACIEGSKMDGNNPYFKSRYSTLSSVWDACRKPLSDNGLSVVQLADNCDSDTITVETILAHSSGEWIKGRLSMKPVKSDPQGIGSCITYARRYSLAAMVGVAPEDDDGNAASQPKFESKATTTKVYEMKPGQAKDVEAALGEEPSMASIEEETIKTDLRNKIKGAAKGITKKDEFLTFCGGFVKTVDQLQEVYDNIEKWKMDFINAQAKEIKR